VGRNLLACTLLFVLSGSAAAQTPLWSAKAGSPANAVQSRRETARVVIAPDVLEGWEFLYRFVTEVEFVLCLEGEERDGRIYVDGFRLARMEAADINSVRYQPCTGDRYIGTAHNHPPVPGVGGVCYRSQPDVDSFAKDANARLDVVLCGADRFVWILRDGTHGGSPADTGPGR
jgi:hypothetical protein